MRLLLLSFLLILSSCGSYKKFKKLSRPEKGWVLTHLFIAKKTLRISEQARAKSKEMESNPLLDGDANGGQVDAFRHSYWMASLAQEIKPKKALKLGKAHEKGNEIDYRKGKLEENILPDKASVEMDLFNNQVGIAIGEKEEKKNLEKIVIQKIRAGEMRIIRKNCEGNSLDSLGNVISTNQWQGKWENKRQVVPSNRKVDC